MGLYGSAMGYSTKEHIKFAMSGTFQPNEIGDVRDVYLCNINIQLCRKYQNAETRRGKTNNSIVVCR